MRICLKKNSFLQTVCGIFNVFGRVALGEILFNKLMKKNSKIIYDEEIFIDTAENYKLINFFMLIKLVSPFKQ